ncbi:hypothetical protein LTR94_036045, partial [Friedmanniomyces endolithicus]
MADKLRIMLVEDEALVAMLVEDALTLHGHIVTGVADTQAGALALAARLQQGHFERARIDRRQHLALLDQLAL